MVESGEDKELVYLQVEFRDAKFEWGRKSHSAHRLLDNE